MKELENKKTILVVDDTETNIDILLTLLSEEYDILVSMEGEGALEIIDEEDNIDLILLDIMMPNMDGYEVCQRLKANKKTKDIPVIFITAKTDEDSIEKAYEVGGIDYITKPFRPREVMSRLSTHLSLSEQKKMLEIMKNNLEGENFTLELGMGNKLNEIYALNKEIKDTQKEVVFTMGSIGELRSKETGNHVKRVARYSEILASGYGMKDNEVALLGEASPMHDIGKVAIPDAILNKPAKFTPEEFKKMQEHTTLGHEMLKGSKRELMQTAEIVAYQHHERWDGKGYPQGLKGEDIHIYGRITAIADVFDALGSARVYKDAWEDEKIFNLFREESGKQFDPKLVDVFFENLDKILEVRDNLVDN